MIYFLIAVAAHLRVGDWNGITAPTVVLVMSVATLTLRHTTMLALRRKRFGHRMWDPAPTASASVVGALPQKRPARLRHSRIRHGSQGAKGFVRSNLRLRT